MDRSTTGGATSGVHRLMSETVKEHIRYENTVAELIGALCSGKH
jgi:hypothetical protein